MKDQRAFGPLRRLVCEAVAAVPAAGGAVAALLAVGVAVVVAAILDMSWTAKQVVTCKVTLRLGRKPS